MIEVVLVGALAVALAAWALYARRPKARDPTRAPRHLRVAHRLMGRRWNRLLRLHARTQLVLRPGDPDYLNILANQAFQRNDYPAALRLAARAFERCPDPFTRASLAIVASLACARIPDADGAGFWMGQAIRTRPEMRGYIERDPFLAQAAKRPEFRQWLNPTPGDLTAA